MRRLDLFLVTAILLSTNCGGRSNLDTLSASVGGTTSIGGTTATGGEPSTGGIISTGGSKSTGGTTDSGGTTSTAVDCRTVDCSFPVCEAGYTSVTYAGSCCPVCVAGDSSCAGVTCATPSCPSGYTVAREPGACCDTCVATPSAKAPYCETVDCGTPSSCPLGYIVTNTAWTCCPTCASDPNYCETDADCMLAWDQTSCCSCNGISTRRYAQDPCYSSASGDSRSVPASCARPDNCPFCPSCALLGHASSTCSNHHCS
jgi:hypothetical protein